jgi:hypothetical protein
MTVTVGTDTYGTVAEADTYWAARSGDDWAGLTTAEKEPLLVKAADYLDRNFRWRGVKATAAQRLQWPRTDAYDDNAYLQSSTVTPELVKEAQFIVADLYRSEDYDLEGIVTGDNAIKKQKIDVIEVEYAVTSRIQGADKISHVSAMLRPWTFGPGLLRS